MRALRRWLRIRKEQNQKGYVLIVFALTLLPLMALAGFSVDVGAWYSETMSMQRAADSASLAGVVWMPDINKATQVATAAAARNNYVDGQNNIRIRISGNNDDKLTVTITNADAPRFFTRVLLSNETLTRTSTSEYRLPLPLGSPKNTFGTGDIFAGADQDKVWAAVNGYCAGRENGDPTQAGADATYNVWTGYQCPGTTPNSDYDVDGYYYSIDVPSTAMGNLGVWLFDPAFDNGRGDSTLDANPSVTTTYTLYAPGPMSTMVPTGGPVIAQQTFASGSTTYKNQWMRMFNGPLTAGRYFVQVQTQANEAASWGSNGFSIEALIGGGNPGDGSVGSGTGACSTITTAANYSPNCPQVHGVKSMSILNNLSGQNQADFYLAEVDPAYAGKKLKIALFDPGEGASAIQVLDPNGNPATFTWSVDCVNDAPATGGCSGGPTTSLDVSGTGTQPRSGLSGNGRYNDRSVMITVQLPSDYIGTYGTNQWFKIRYQTNGASTDRTTWSADIEGTPVHLLGIG